MYAYSWQGRGRHQLTHGSTFLRRLAGYRRAIKVLSGCRVNGVIPVRWKTKSVHEGDSDAVRIPMEPHPKRGVGAQDIMIGAL